jgi:hypothetical protein
VLILDTSEVGSILSHPLKYTESIIGLNEKPDISSKSSFLKKLKAAYQASL